MARAKKSNNVAMAEAVKNETSTREVFLKKALEVAGTASKGKLDTLSKMNGEYVDELNKGAKANEDVLKAKKKAASAALKEANYALRKKKYVEWEMNGGAIKTAIDLRFVPDTIRVSFQKNDKGIYEVVTEIAETKASLPEIQETLGKDVFVDAEWFTKAQALAFLYATKLARKLGDSNFTYKVEDIARTFKFDSKQPIYSDKFFFELLQNVMDCIYKGIEIETVEDDNGVPYSKEWTVITESVTKQGKGVGEVAIYAIGKFTELVLDVMHILYHKGSFKLTESKK